MHSHMCKDLYARANKFVPPLGAERFHAICVNGTPQFFTCRLT